MQSVTKGADSEQNTFMKPSRGGWTSGRPSSWIKTGIANIIQGVSLSEEDLPFYETHEEAWKNYRTERLSNKGRAERGKGSVTDKGVEGERSQGEEAENTFDEEKKY